MAESKVVSDILLAFGSRPGLRIWRANVLVARDRTGRIVRAGIKGQADISGVLAPLGRRIEIECKSDIGRQTKEQKLWQAMIEKHGGLYILARTVEDVEKALTASPSPSSAASATP